MNKVLCFGSLNLDHIYQVDDFVRPGETKSAKAVETRCGGKGYNQAVAAAQAGLPVFLAGSIGLYGDAFVESCKNFKIDISELKTSTAPTGSAVIQVNQAGENCILLFGGANQEISVQQIDHTLQAFGSGDILIVQNEISNMPYLLTAAGKKGLRIALNPSPMSNIFTPALLALVTWIFVNEVETEQLTGEPFSEAALEKLQALCPHGAIIATAGTKGAYYRDRTCRFYQKAFSVKAVDTTAAGDTFTGYFLAELLRSSDPARALELAARASALAVTRPGASDSIPRLDEVLAWRGN